MVNLQTLYGKADPVIVRALQELATAHNAHDAQLVAAQQALASTPRPLSLSEISQALTVTGAAPLNLVGLQGSMTVVTSSSGGGGGSFTPGAVLYAVTATTIGGVATATAGLALVSGAFAAPSWFTPAAANVIYAGVGGILASSTQFTFAASPPIFTLTNTTASDAASARAVTLDFWGTKADSTLINQGQILIRHQSGSNDGRGDMLFSTSNNAGTLTEKMRIQYDGQIFLGSTAQSGQVTIISGSNNKKGYALVENASPFSLDFGTNSTQPILFQPNGSTSFMLKSGGDVGLGGTLTDTASNNLTGAAFVIVSNQVGIGTIAPGALLDLGLAGTTLGALRMAGSTSGNVSVTVAATAGTWTLTLPTTGGTNNYVLTTNGSGTTTWTDASTVIGGYVSSITGTANQVIASASTGAVTLSLPQSIATSSTPQFSALGLGGAAGSASTLKITGTTSGSVAIAVAATVGGTYTITLPKGSTDFSSTGGTGQVVRQSSGGAAFTVATLASTELSDTANLAYLNAANAFTSTSPNTFSGHVTTSGNHTLYGVKSGSVTKIGCTGNENYFAITSSQTFTFTFGDTNGFVFIINDNVYGCALCITDYFSSTISVTGNANILNSAAPALTQIGVSKSASSAVITVKTGATFGSNQISVLSLNGYATATTDPA